MIQRHGKRIFVMKCWLVTIDDYSAPGTCWALGITTLVIQRLKTGQCLLTWLAIWDSCPRGVHSPIGQKDKNTVNKPTHQLADVSRQRTRGEGHFK